MRVIKVGGGCLNGKKTIEGIVENIIGALVQRPERLANALPGKPLAILEAGIKRADGSPDELMQQMGAHVVEIASTNLRQLKQELIELNDVITAAQLGARLRVLVKNNIADPLAFLAQQKGISSLAELTLVRPSLEDVFVTRTGEGRQ